MNLRGGKQFVAWVSMGLLLLSCTPKLWAQSAGSEATNTADPKALGASSKPLLVRGVNIHGEAGELTVDLETSSAPEFKSFELEAPHRLVIDIQNAELVSSHQNVRVQQAGIRNVRVAQFSSATPKVVRAVFLMDSKPTYSLTSSPNAVRLTAQINRIAATPSPRPKEAAVWTPVAPQPAAPPEKSSLITAENRPATVIRGLEARKEGDSLVVHLRSDGVLKYKSFELDKPQRLVFDLHSVVLRSPRRLFNINEGVLLAARLGQYTSGDEPTVRAVFEESKKTGFQVESSNEGLRFIFPLAEMTTNTTANSIETPIVNQELKTVSENPEKTTPDKSPFATKEVVAASSMPEPIKPVPTPTIQLNAPLPLPNPVLLDGTVHEAPVDSPSNWATLPDRLTSPVRPPVQVARLSQLDSLKSSWVNPQIDSPKPPAPTVAPAVNPSPEKKVKVVPVKEGRTVASFSAISNVKPNAPPDVSPIAPKAEAKTPGNNASEMSAAKSPSVPPTETKPPAAKSVSSGQPIVEASSAASPRTAVEPKLIAASLAQQITVQTPDAQKMQTPLTVPTPAPSNANPSDIISLDLRDVDIRDFFRLIHEVSGLNIILDPSVRGTVTLALKDVPWEQALDIVLQNNQLAKQLQGNVLRIVTMKSLQEEQEARRKILESRVAEEEAAARQTFTRVPNYLKAEDLAKIFTQLLGVRAGTSADEVIFDASTNMVIVLTTQKKMDELDKIMKAMDVRSQQVEIEARVVAANRSFLRDLGTQLGFQAFSSSLNNVVGGLPSLNSPVVRTPRPPLSSSQPSSGGSTSTGPLPLNTNLGASAATSGLSYLYSSGNLLLDSFISAAESKGTAKLLSKPKIITQNHKEGTVEQGIQIPVQTVVNNTVSNQFLSFSLKLTVTPQITADGSVFLDSTVENSTPDFNREVGGIPTIQTQKAKTQVLINDGGTVVIGGVLIDQDQTNVRSVPGLGSMPVIGNLFRNKSVQTSTQELLFFLTPKILK
ncbi:MAG: type IV pilus secretin PilQ [Acidobacteriia bacterium]|nr:type IV pilus secretin PilQ [Terriglobia bacterium]